MHFTGDSAASDSSTVSLI